MASDLTARLTGLVDKAAREHGLELVLVEVAGSRRNPLVRIYLDREGGIGIDAIAEANRWIKEIAEAQPELADSHYTLEVSSPGIERPLVKLADFVRFAGQRAKVSVSPEIDGHKHFLGTITGVEGKDIFLETDDGPVRIPHASVTRARLRVEIDINKEGTDL